MMGKHVEQQHEYFGMYDLFQEACHGQDQHWYFELSTAAESVLLIEFSNNAYDYDDIKNEKTYFNHFRFLNLHIFTLHLQF